MTVCQRLKPIIVNDDGVSLTYYDVLKALSLYAKP